MAEPCLGRAESKETVLEGVVSHSKEGWGTDRQYLGAGVDLRMW